AGSQTRVTEIESCLKRHAGVSQSWRWHRLELVTVCPDPTLSQARADVWVGSQSPLTALASRSYSHTGRASQRTRTASQSPFFVRAYEQAGDNPDVLESHSRLPCGYPMA